MYAVAKAQPQERASFIRKTYTHLAGAVGAFIAVEYVLFQTGIAAAFASLVLSSRFAWLAVLGAFALLGWLSSSLAARADNVNLQYTGLGIYVIAEALIFAPLVYIASQFADPSVIPTAAILTLFLFGGLSAVVFTTGKDFSFLGGILKIGGFVVLGLIVCSAVLNFPLGGLIFSGAMIIFAAASILYSTSNVMNHYSSEQYVAAALELFASVALLFWYILQFLMSLNRR
jgi:FtsH-binding integral membrane protein